MHLYLYVTFCSIHLSFLKGKKNCRAWWYMPITLDTREMKVGRSKSKASPGKSMRPYLRNNLKAKVLEV
jgi:formylglycine-generating enzyme required for sulfatase activity